MLLVHYYFFLSVQFLVEHGSNIIGVCPCPTSTSNTFSYWYMSLIYINVEGVLCQSYTYIKLLRHVLYRHISSTWHMCQNDMSQSVVYKPSQRYIISCWNICVRIKRSWVRILVDPKEYFLNKYILIIYYMGIQVRVSSGTYLTIASKTPSLWLTREMLGL